MTLFSLATGLRQGNVKGLKWSQIDLARRIVVIEGDEMKAGRDHALPLPDVAVEVLKRQIGRHDVFVFVNDNGEPVRSGNHGTWRDACRRAGIEDFRQHDLRHTWATTLVQAGVPDGVLQALGAWETPKMVKRYAHHSADSMRKFTGQIDAVLGSATEATQKTDAPLLKLVG
jgi:integrase